MVGVGCAEAGESGGGGGSDRGGLEGAELRLGSPNRVGGFGEFLVEFLHKLVPFTSRFWPYL